jgi:23S rRNA (guanosine2251-2'-O)-methyltransferase
LANPERKIRRMMATAESFAALAAEIPHKIKVEKAERAQIDRRLPPGAVHQGVAIEADPLPETTLGDVMRSASLRSSAMVLMLDQVTDPHNVGAILRSAAMFGALAVIMQDRHSPAETGTLAKASSGALEIVPLVRVVNLSRALETLKTEAQFRLYALDASAEVTLAEAGCEGRLVLVLGSEGEGIRPKVRETCDRLVRLPTKPRGTVDSLNVSNAAAVALYEVARK